GIPGPVMFDKKNYNLSWTSHPSPAYYKHEYLPAGENADKFKTMLMIEVVTGNLNIKDIAAAKVEELKKMKETNPVVNYETFDNPKTGEYMIDFLLTANTPQGKISIAERNVYRYKSITDASGQKAILLFGVSNRSYGEAATSFIASLKGNRKTLVDQVAKFDIPAVKLTR
ncbi:MAG: hypothetical protein ABUT20_42585, partial [Bacteroidota bacterium]